MANENPAVDFAGMIKALRVHQEAVATAINSLLVASGAMIPIPEGGASAAFNPQGSGGQQPTELPRGAFIGKSLPAAVKLYLSAVIKKQTIKEISSALREGGVESTSDNFDGVITGCLHRMKLSGEVLQFKDGWGLAENYPPHIRASLSHPTATRKRKSAKKRPKKSKKTAKTADENQSDRHAAPPVEGLKHVLEKFARSRTGEWFSYRDAAQAVPTANAKVVALTLGRLAKDFAWEKDANGRYRAFADNLKEMPKAV